MPTGASQRADLVADLLGGQEPAVRAGRFRDRQVAGARDATGDRVQWLLLAPEPRRRAGVEQRAGRGQRGGAGRVEHRHRTRRDGEVTPWTLDRLRRCRVAGGHPGGQAAVEHPHVRMAGPAQDPPRPCGGPAGRRAALVVHHDRVIFGDAQVAQRLLQDGRIGQWVPAAPATRLCSGRPGQDGVPVQEGRTGQVFVLVLGFARGAHVEQGRRPRRGEGGDELRDADQRVHGNSLSYRAGTIPHREARL